MRSADEADLRSGREPGILIVAGGQGSRCGGLDKGWMEFDGEPLVIRHLRELRDNGFPLAISANRSLDRYAVLGVPIIMDRDAADPDRSFPGPLAAVSAALHAGFGDPLITLPVDALHVPPGVLRALLDASEEGTRAVFACDAEGAQPMVALWPRCALTRVDRALLGEERAVRRLQHALGALAIEFPTLRFGNVNSLTDLATC